MNNIIKMALTLAAIGIISGLLLTGLSLWTGPILKANQQQQHIDLLQQFFPGAKETVEEEVEEIIFDIVYDEDNSFIGLLALAETDGYGGKIVYYLALGEKGDIEGIYVLSHTETPGIGDVIIDSGFHEKIEQLDVIESFEVGVDIDLITGATVSTGALLISIKEVGSIAAANFYDNNDLE